MSLILERAHSSRPLTRSSPRTDVGVTGASGSGLQQRRPRLSEVGVLLHALGLGAHLPRGRELSQLEVVARGGVELRPLHVHRVRTLVRVSVSEIPKLLSHSDFQKYTVESRMSFFSLSDVQLF